MFHQLTLKVDYILEKFGMTLSGGYYIMCRSVCAATTRRQPPLYIARLRAVSVGQVKSKDAPCSED